MSDSNQKNTGLRPYMSPAGAWALSLGTTIGWGSLVVTSNTYLPQAGPVGSVIGMVIGMVIMLFIARNYHYMTGCFPGAGGAYTYTKEVFGHDYGFLTSWFLMLTYLAILWANATSLPLFARYFMGGIFQFGKLYTIFGYEVYLGEALLTMAAVAIVMLISMRSRKAVMWALIVMCILFTVGIIVVFVMAMTGARGAGHVFSPGYVPDKNAVSQIVKIACISPWAFIGFENVSHLSEEFTFSRNRLFRIMLGAILTATLLYVLIFILSVSAYPPQYDSWLSYIRDIGNLSGMEGLPAFYAAQQYMGPAGIYLLMAALLALVITSLFGNLLALSRLFYALAKDGIIFKGFSALNRFHIPWKTVILVGIITLPIPFVGRTAIGWIVDVTTIGATLVYAFISASAFRMAKSRGDRRETVDGLVGTLLMIAFEAYLLLPNLFTRGSMEKETYFLFVVWAVLGFVFFRGILRRDEEKRFGQSLVVWIGLLTLVLLIALIWMNQSMLASSDQAMQTIHEYYQGNGAMTDIRTSDEAFVMEQMVGLGSSNSRTMVVMAALFVFALVIMITNYSYMNRKARESEEALGTMKAMANTDPLTGVKSKRAFLTYEGKLNADIENGEEQSFALVVCDVNGLKHVNDTYGHKAGDAYICEASDIICGIFSHSPVFRVGGDEFVAILTGRDFENRRSLMETLHRRVEENIGTGRAVVSGGCSDFRKGEDRLVHTVFERADARMYEKKKELKSKGSKTRS